MDVASLLPDILVDAKYEEICEPATGNQATDSRKMVHALEACFQGNSGL